MPFDKWIICFMSLSFVSRYMLVCLSEYVTVCAFPFIDEKDSKYLEIFIN